MQFLWFHSIHFMAFVFVLPLVSGFRHTYLLVTYPIWPGHAATKGVLALQKYLKLREFLAFVAQIKCDILWQILFFFPTCPHWIVERNWVFFLSWLADKIFKGVPSSARWGRGEEEGGVEGPEKPSTTFGRNCFKIWSLWDSRGNVLLGLNFGRFAGEKKEEKFKKNPFSMKNSYSAGKFSQRKTQLK